MNRWIKQDVLVGETTELKLNSFTLDDIGISTALAHLSRTEASILGISLRMNNDGDIEAVALSTTTQVYLLSARVASRARGRLSRLFCGDALLVGFTMAEVALSMKRELGCHIAGVDLSTLFSEGTIDPSTPATIVHERLFQGDVSRVREIWDRDLGDNVCLRAFVCACIGDKHQASLGTVRRVDTRSLYENELRILGAMSLQIHQLQAQKPRSVENDFTEVVDTHEGLVIHNSRHKTKVRPGSETQVIIETASGEISGRAIGMEGKRTMLRTFGGKFDGNALRVRVVGREDQTLAEKARAEFLLLALRGERSLQESSFIRLFWFPGTKEETLLRQIQPSNKPTSDRPKLNKSQNRVVDAMMDDNMPLIIVQGPPGTGKTSTIAAAVQESNKVLRDVWIVAQSNVAVKNIAEKLVKEGVDFRLLVSKEFHFEWHEHIYEDVEKFLIRSDEFPRKDLYAVERVFGSARTVLCTLSMLSNPVLDTCRIFDVVSIQTLIIDEASQINAFDYMHLFHKFEGMRQLEKVCLFGDPQQLPPYGQDQAPTIQSVFQIKQFANLAFFLDTQYRMPIELGKFLSKEVYNGRLQSKHEITDASCIRFIDVSRGFEETSGSSFENTDEVTTVNQLIRNYYSDKEVCIITPYDTQRQAISNDLKASGLSAWEHVYNVDSFQGNEADYVIISVVRTDRPGFLHSLERMNVMLSRCKKGMVVVTNRDFLVGSGSKTLLGKMSRRWSSIAGREIWISWRDVMNGCVDLPGANAPKPLDEVAQITASLPRLALGTVTSPPAISGNHRSVSTTPGASCAPENGISAKDGDSLRLPLRLDSSTNANIARPRISTDVYKTKRLRAEGKAQDKAASAFPPLSPRSPSSSSNTSSSWRMKGSELVKATSKYPTAFAWRGDAVSPHSTFNISPLSPTSPVGAPQWRNSPPLPQKLAKADTFPKLTTAPVFRTQGAWGSSKQKAELACSESSTMGGSSSASVRSKRLQAQVNHSLSLVEALKASHSRRRGICFTLETIASIEDAGHSVPKSMTELHELIQHLETQVERLLSQSSL